MLRRLVTWGPRLTLPLGLIMAYVLGSGVACAAAYNAAQVAARPTVVRTEWREHGRDLTDPFERCLAAMGDAEIPADVGLCVRPPQPV